MASLSDRFNLKKQFVFYASYHNDPINIIIHLICIWPIFATTVVFLQYTPTFASTPAFIESLPSGKDVHVNGAFFFITLYMAWYILMEPFAGSLASLLILTIFVKSGQYVAAGATILGLPVWKAALAIHVTAWIIQFIGHGVFEGRAPALLDSWDQAFITAPLFVFLEILFAAGYRSEFHASMMKEVERNVKSFQKQKSK